MSSIKTLQATSGGLWSVASPIIAVVVAVPLSVALTTSVMARQNTATETAPTVSTAAYTPVASMSGQSDMSACTAPVAASAPDHTVAPVAGSGQGHMNESSWNEAPMPVVEHASTPVTNVSNAWNTYTSNINNENYWFSLYKSSLNANNSFNSYKDSFNTVNSNNRDDSQTQINANGGSTVVAPTNTSSNVTIGQGNQQSSELTNDNLAATSTENTTKNTTTNTSVNTDIRTTSTMSDPDPVHHMPWENGDPDPAHHKS